MRPSITIYLDDRRQKKNGKYPLKMRVTYGSRSHYYPVRVDLSTYEFELFNLIHDRKNERIKALNLKVRKQLAEIRLIADKLLVKAEDSLNRMTGQFSFEEFNEQFGKKGHIKQQDVYDLFEEEIERHKNDGKISTAIGVRTSMNSLKKFRKHLGFNQVTKSFLEKYETQMLQEGKSITTVGIYLRDLRTVFNLAIEKGLVLTEKYPFGKGRGKYKMPSGKGTKRALTVDQLKLIYSYRPTSKWEQWSKDLWMFSYFCQGINMTDISYLKPSNIEDGMLRFVRRKTASSSRANINPISIPIVPEIQEIIDRYCGQSSTYLFPILHDGQDKVQQYKTIQQAIKMVNNYFSIIANNVGIEGRVTTYWARHTYATLLKKANIGVEFISEALGHTSIQTTRAYLDSFEDDFKREMGQLSASFVK